MIAFRWPRVTKTCPRCGQGRVFMVPDSARGLAAQLEPSQPVTAVQCSVRISHSGHVVALCAEVLTLTAADVLKAHGRVAQPAVSP